MICDRCGVRIHPVQSATEVRIGRHSRFVCSLCHKQLMAWWYQLQDRPPWEFVKRS